MKNVSVISYLRCRTIVCAIALAASITRSAYAQGTAPVQPAHLAWSRTPPMGWNSWDSFATTVTESITRDQATYMQTHLASLGWQYIVVDIQWYEPNATGFDYRKGAPLSMDQYGRLFPAVNKFPSAANDVGFKSLADDIHAKGLKFGVHLMRGIPRQAVRNNTPILGTLYHASDIADTSSVCRWNTDMYGVDTSKPGAQAYYDSVFRLFASWGVDFVKVDDLSQPYHQSEVEAIRSAIDASGRPMVFSTSPGDTPLTAGESVSRNANMWRISGDFWDSWNALKAQFDRTQKWAQFAGPGHFPDADMLPIGVLRNVANNPGGTWTKFTHDEQRTMMTLWAIARSPLMMGGDMTKNDPFTLSLLTNADVIAVDQFSSGNHQMFNRDGHIAWVANVPNSNDTYLAVFNTTDVDDASDMTARGALGALNYSSYRVWDLWEQADLGANALVVFRPLPRHGAALYRVAH